MQRRESDLPCNCGMDEEIKVRYARNKTLWSMNNAFIKPEFATFV